MDTKNLANWENEMNICIRCGYCFEGCPIFKELHWEIDGARGKVMLSYGLFTGQLEPSQYIVDKIYECTFCKDCLERCSANVSVPDILSAARADLVNAGFTYPSHRALLDKIKATGNIFGEKLSPPKEEGDTPVLLGCRFLKRTDDATRYLEILKKLGIKPMTFEEICCGMPFAVLGYKEEFQENKKKFMERLPSKEIICMCTTCAFFIRKAYPELKARYIIEVIYEKIKNYSPKKLGKKVTYHDPCNVSRGINMVDEPRELLKIIGVELVELPTHGKQTECCGGGGGLLITNKPLSEKLADKRLNQAIQLGVDTLVTLCPTCELNLSNASKRSGKIQVKNLLDLIWEAM